MSFNLNDKTANAFNYTVTTGTVVETPDITGISGSDISADFSATSTITCSSDFTNIDTHDFTIELWLKQAAATGDRVLFNKGNAAGGQIYIQDNDTIVTQVNNTSVTSTSTITTTNATHLAFAYNKVGGTIKIYQDGSLIETISGQSTNGIPNNASGAAISSSLSAAMKIDEYRIWSTERTLSEIQNNRNIRLNGDEAGLVVYLQFGDNPVITGESSYAYFM